MNKRPRVPVIRSRINKHRAKDDVVKAMDRKLASGPDLIVARADMDRARTMSKFLSYATIYGSLIVAGVLSIGVFNFVVKTPKRAPLTICTPVVSLDQDYKDRKISVDRYATYLCCLLVRYPAFLTLSE